MELLDHVSDYTILKGVNCYESLGRYYLAHRRQSSPRTAGVRGGWEHPRRSTARKKQP